MTSYAALVALSPWPDHSASESLQAALTELKQHFSLPSETQSTTRYDNRLRRVALAASKRIESYASGAPVSVKNEAMIRAVGYLIDTTGAKRFFRPDERTLNPDNGNFPAEDWAAPPSYSGNWFRASGAMSLLSPWRTCHQHSENAVNPSF